jgi:class 3 adenylate cyclase
MKTNASAEAWLQPSRGSRIMLEGTCNLGRSADNHVVIEARAASRYHAAIRAQAPNEYWIVDLGSANGTFHNGRRVIRPTLLKDGDRISVADVTLCFRQVVVQDVGEDPSTLGEKTVPEMKEEDAWLVMADLQGSTELSHRVAGEELAQLLQQWTQSCREAVESHRGQIGKYLGDGFLAYWLARQSSPADVVAALHRLHSLRSKSARAFRLAVHYGPVTFGGVAALGEEVMRGSEVNFIFRLERLASTCALETCVSEAARERLGELMCTAPLDEEHEVKGFGGRHRIYTIRWPAC